MFDDDAPKRSWRDIDRKKDESKHVSKDMKRAGGTRARTAASGYKWMLENFFEGGKAPEHVKKQLEKMEKPKGGQKRQKMLKAVKDAISSRDVEEAIDAYLSRYENMPADMDFLLQVLLHSDEDMVRDAIQQIDEIINRRLIKRKDLLMERLRRIDNLCDEDETRTSAQSLRRKLQ